MGRHVVLYSGGVGSYCAAKRVIARHGTATLLFTDTKTEDADLYRFLDDSEKALGVQVTRIADGRDIWQVFKDRRFLGYSRVDPCTDILKPQQSRKWLTANSDPAETVVYIGYDWTEPHRLERLAARWKP